MKKQKGVFMTFHDIYAVADTRPRCYFSFENDEDQYFEHGFIHLYGIPDPFSCVIPVFIRFRTNYVQ